MNFIKDPAEQTTAVTDIVLALIAFGGIVFLRWPLLNSGQLWKINIWSAAIGLIGLAAVREQWLMVLFYPAPFIIVSGWH